MCSSAGFNPSLCKVCSAWVTQVQHSPAESRPSHPTLQSLRKAWKRARKVFAKCLVPSWLGLTPPWSSEPSYAIKAKPYPALSTPSDRVRAASIGRSRSPRGSFHSRKFAKSKKVKSKKADAKRFPSFSSSSSSSSLSSSSTVKCEVSISQSLYMSMKALHVQTISPLNHHIDKACFMFKFLMHT